MSAGQSQRSVASSTRRRQEVELAAAEERERAAARASRLAAAELAAAREEAEAAAAANAARAAATEVEALRGSIGSSISADDTVDADLELLEREAARARAAQWVMDKSHVWSLWGCTAHMVLVAVFLLLGQHLRLEDNRTAS